MATANSDNYIEALKQVIREYDTLIVLNVPTMQELEKMKALRRRANALLTLKPGEALIPDEGTAESILIDEATSVTEEQWQYMRSKHKKQFRC